MAVPRTIIPSNFLDSCLVKTNAFLGQLPCQNQCIMHSSFHIKWALTHTHEVQYGMPWVTGGIMYSIGRAAMA